MIEKKTNKKKYSAGSRSSAKSALLTRPFVQVQTMCADLNVTLKIKEDSP